MPVFMLEILGPKNKILIIDLSSDNFFFNSGVRLLVELKASVEKRP